MPIQVINPQDLSFSTGQDFSFQVVITDHRGDPVPFSLPAQMTCKDSVGQTAFATTMASETGLEASITTSEINGLIQVTVPRQVTAKIPSGMYYYDIWATLSGDESDATYPKGQQTPVVSGRIRVTGRLTHLDNPEATE